MQWLCPEKDAICREFGEHIACEMYMYKDEELESEGGDALGVYDDPTAT